MVVGEGGSIGAGACAVVLGGYVNGYSIIRELRDSGVDNIWLLDSRRSLASFSNKIAGFTLIPLEATSLSAELHFLSKKFSRLVVFPTAETHLEILSEIHEEICGFCFLPYNKETLASYIDKRVQYIQCERLRVPYPLTVDISNLNEIRSISQLQYPVIIKPKKKDVKYPGLFRALRLDTPDDLSNSFALLESCFDAGIELMVSEFIPGDDGNIYSYSAYRSADGGVINEWAGRKLNQCPDEFGVFSSASNEAPCEIWELGRRLVEGMDVVGIIEPEFKFDPRDGRYKLMEVSLRSTMWHRLGNRSGVNLLVAQWNDALGRASHCETQVNETRIHLFYLKHELVNLICRSAYLKNFLRNLFGAQRLYFAVFNWRDMKPALRDLMTYPRTMVGACLRRFKAR